jgi:hypothetical protein
MMDPSKPISSNIRIVPHFKCGMEGLFNLSQEHIHQLGREHQLDNRLHFDSKPCKIFCISPSKSKVINNENQNSNNLENNITHSKNNCSMESENEKTSNNRVHDQSKAPNTSISSSPVIENLASLTHYSPQYLVAVTTDSVTCTLLHPSKKSIADTELKRPQYKFRFRAKITCADVNQFSNSATSIELAIGFSTGDILIHDPLQHPSTKNVQFNKDV